MTTLRAALPFAGKGRDDAPSAPAPAPDSFLFLGNPPVVLRLRPETNEDAPVPAGVKRWSVGVVHLPEGEPVGSIEVTKVHFSNIEHPFTHLSAVDDSLEIFGEVLEYDRDQLNAVYPLEHGCALVVESVRLEPEWSGRGLGPLLLGTVIEALRGGVDVVMLHPSPLNPPSMRPEEYVSASLKLSQVWSRLGFTQYNDKVWAVNPRDAAFSHGLSAARARPTPHVH